MAFRTFVFLALLLSTACAPTPTDSGLELARLFGDGMVVQRDAAVPVWGWATPGTRVRVTFDGEEGTARAAEDGTWEVELPPRPAGGPFELTVAAGGEERVLHDVLVGDVWLCSGQSNMEWTVADSLDAETEIAAAVDAEIRHFKVPKSWAAEPQEKLTGGAWDVTDPGRVGDFTAVGYFFARELRPHVDVPIGLIHASWGGSRIEPWMSAEALGFGPDAAREIAELEREYEERILGALEARIGGLPKEDAGLADGDLGEDGLDERRALWADPDLDDSGWDEIEVPGRWEELGFEGLDGVVWFRTAFELTAAEAAAGADVGLGLIDDGDVTWVNGHRVGGMELAWNQLRRYPVPASALRPGRNVLTVRVEDTGGGGGIYGEPADLYVEALGQRQPLAGTWKVRVGIVAIGMDGRKNQIPTYLYNQMIHPLTRYPVRGALWYQGESNAGALDAFVYRDHFAGLIGSWRADWGRGDFPFLFVQLANFLASGEEPVDSSWALLRESQSAALKLPKTAQAIAIDIGEPLDVHPRNKQDVGRRLALAARKVAYGEDLVDSGPVYRGHEIRGGRVTVEFDHVGGGLVAGDRANEVEGFTVAGSNREFLPAAAVLDGDRVVVWNAAVPEPLAVRYAWGDSPAATLYNQEGLPAAPFRTDDWELRTDG